MKSHEGADTGLSMPAQNVDINACGPVACLKILKSQQLILGKDAGELLCATQQVLGIFRQLELYLAKIIPAKHISSDQFNFAAHDSVINMISL